MIFSYHNLLYKVPYNKVSGLMGCDTQKSSRQKGKELHVTLYIELMIKREEIGF